MSEDPVLSEEVKTDEGTVIKNYKFSMDYKSAFVAAFMVLSLSAVMLSFSDKDVAMHYIDVLGGPWANLSIGAR